MNNNESKIQLLEQYIDGSLSEADNNYVELLLSENPGLNRHYESMTKAVELVQYAAIQGQVSDVASRFFAKEEVEPGEAKLVSIKPRLKTWGLRAAAILLIATTGYGIVQHQSATPEKIYNNAFVPFELQETRSNQKDNDLEQAYKAGNWKMVLEISGEIEELSEKQLFLSGVAALQSKQYTNATDLFIRISELNRTKQTSSYQDEAEYYTFLCHLKTGKEKEAASLFTKIYKNPDHNYYRQVQSIGLTKIKLMQLH